MIRLAFVPIARPTFDVALAQAMMASAREHLSAAGYDLISPPDLLMSLADLEAALELVNAQAPDLLILFQASFADSTMAQRLATAIDAPLLLWAIPEERTGGRLRLNSFCGINLAAHALRRAGSSYGYLYAAPDDPAALETINTVARAALARQKLKNARFGRVGVNPDGFETCLFDSDNLRAKLGVEILQLELESVFDGVRQTDPAAIAQLRTQVAAQIDNLDELNPSETDGTLATYVTLNNIAQEQKLKGFSVRCWPEFFTDLGCSACGALSMLSNAHTPSSCEADVNGTLTQYILQTLSDQPAFGSDIVAFDFETDQVIFWHCGLAPLAMADPAVQPRGTLHSNRQKPLLFEFPLKEGRVTLARLSEASGELRLVIGGGEMIAAPPSFSGTSGTLRFDSGAEAVFNTLMREGLEHHLSLTYGDHQASLAVLAGMLDLPVLWL